MSFFYHSIEDAALVCWDHVFYVYEGVLATGLFEELEGLADQVAEVETFSLTVLYFVSDAGVTVSEDVENWEDLPVVRYKSLSNHLSRQN